MKIHEALNQIRPDRHLLDGNIGLGDYLVRMVQWIQKVPVNILDEEAMEAVRAEMEKNKQTIESRFGVPQKTIFPGKTLADLLGEWLKQECPPDKISNYIVRFGPEFTSPIASADEASMQQRHATVMVPLPLPKSENKLGVEHEPKTWKNTDFQFEGQGLVAAPRKIEV